MKHEKIKRLAIMGMLAAVSYLMVMIIRIPVVSFLKYEPKDVIITVAGFLCGPMASVAISGVVSLLEMVTLSDTGFIGCVMNFVSTCSFACVAAVIYKKHRSQTGAVIGLVAGSLAMVAVMLLWNWLLTPLYMGVPRSAVVEMLVPVFLPFNLLKAGLNSAFSLLIYKPVSRGLRKARLLPPSSGSQRKSRMAIPLLAVAVVITCVLVILSLQGIL